MRRILPAAVALSLLLPPCAALAQRKIPPAGGGNPSRGGTYLFFVGGDLLGGLDPSMDPVIMAAELLPGEPADAAAA